MVNGITERMNRNHEIISIHQKSFIQTKAVPSVLKWRLGWAGYNLHAAISGITNSVFMTEFDSFFFGISFYVRGTSLFSSPENFKLYLSFDECIPTFLTMVLITIY